LLIIAKINRLGAVRTDSEKGILYLYVLDEVF